MQVIQLVGVFDVTEVVELMDAVQLLEVVEQVEVVELLEVVVLVTIEVTALRAELMWQVCEPGQPGLGGRCVGWFPPRYPGMLCDLVDLVVVQLAHWHMTGYSGQMVFHWLPSCLQ